MSTAVEVRPHFRRYDATRLRKSFVKSTSCLHHVHHAREELLAGRTVLLVEERGDEVVGHLVVRAAEVRVGAVAFLVRHSAGYLCAAMESRRCDELQLPPCSSGVRDQHVTDFRVAVDAATGVGTGISAADRARTARVLADPATQPADLTRPGHLVPVAADPGGVFAAGASTPESVVELLRTTGRPAVGLYGTVVGLADPTGLPDRAELLRFASENSLVVLTHNDIRMATAHQTEAATLSSQVLLEDLGAVRLHELTIPALPFVGYLLAPSDIPRGAEVVANVCTVPGTVALMAAIAADAATAAERREIAIYVDADPDLITLVAPTMIARALDHLGLSAATDHTSTSGATERQRLRRKELAASV